jgi:hypothetical protein
MTLILKRASACRASGEWSESDYDVLADGVVVGRIMKAAAAPVVAPWLWTCRTTPSQPVPRERQQDYRVTGVWFDTAGTRKPMGMSSKNMF